MLTDAFIRAFAIVVGAEGGFTANPADPGNWTGGKVGVGKLLGTKFGVSAASYPTTDIAGLTIDQAQAIYKTDYWDRVCGDELPPAVALMVFDAAINSGPDRASRWLQAAVGAKVDGQIGPQTLAAVAASAGRGAAVMAEYSAQRIVFLAGLPTWRTFALGWARRVTTLQFHALEMPS